MSKSLKSLLPCFFIVCSIQAQNLVPNASFECGPDNCYVNTTSGVVNACDWNGANKSTSDILSTKILPPCEAAAPQSILGYQMPRTGNRYAGIYTASPGDPSIYREYLQVKLDKPLIPGEYYCGEMYVSLAEEQRFAANNLGMYFHVEKLSEMTYGNIAYTPQILHTDVITDTTGWTKIAGTFKANAAGQYLLIGNFYNDSQTVSIQQHTFSRPWGAAFYFVDDVSVEKVPYNEFTFAGKMAICEGDTTNITAFVGSDNIAWTTLEDTSMVVATGALLKIDPNVTTSYRVKVKGCNKTVTDTITIKVNTLPEVNLGQDTIICAGTTLALDAGDHINFSWNDASKDRYLSVTKAGRYSVEVNNEYRCRKYDEIYVSLRYPPPVELGSDTVVCQQNYFLLNASGPDAFEFKWSDGSTDSIFTPSAAGRYWASASNECGVNSDTINIYSFDDIFIPNVLTLNGDGLNEIFQISGIGTRIGGVLRIYNRLGKEIFTEPNYFNSWPLQTDDLPSGVYYYSLDYPACRDYKGWIHVFR